MKPLQKKLTRVGNSAALTIPAPLARTFGFTPGMTLHVRLVPNGKYFDAVARSFGGKKQSVGILVPKDILVRHGLPPMPTKTEFEAGAKWKTPTILVPFGDWTVVKPISRKVANRTPADRGRRRRPALNRESGR